MAVRFSRASVSSVFSRRLPFHVVHVSPSSLSLSCRPCPCLFSAAPRAPSRGTGLLPPPRRSSPRGTVPGRSPRRCAPGTEELDGFCRARRNVNSGPVPVTCCSRAPRTSRPAALTPVQAPFATSVRPPSRAGHALPATVHYRFCSVCVWFFS